jgi:TorA maturation chaperone TorD
MATDEAQELLSVNENRGAIYVFLATIYAKELAKPFLLDLATKKEFFQRLAEDPETKGTEMAEGFKSIANFASNIRKEDLDRLQLELAAEYAGLFLGVWQTPPHPSESAYMSTDHLIMQKPRDDVMMLYRAMGFEKVKEFTEPEDHIALELQFMANLCEKATAAMKNQNQADARKYLETQRDFLNQHLVKWVPRLVADILKGGRREFYKAVAKVTKGFIEMDKEMVQELVDTLPSGSKPEREAKEPTSGKQTAR